MEGSQHWRRRPNLSVDATAQVVPHDDEDVASNLSICVLGQIAGGALFAFLFGGLGFVISGDAGARSFPWVMGLIVGAWLGVHAARGTVGAGGSHARLQNMTGIHPDILSILITGAGGIVAGIMFYLLAPYIPSSDHLLASIFTATGCWVSHPLADSISEAHRSGWKTWNVNSLMEACSCGLKPLQTSIERYMPGIVKRPQSPPISSAAASHLSGVLSPGTDVASASGGESSQSAVSTSDVDLGP